jgi:hypothetical protein
MRLQWNMTSTVRKGSATENKFKKRKWRSNGSGEEMKGIGFLSSVTCQTAVMAEGTGACMERKDGRNGIMW